jgi:hypothetical protein
MRNRLAFIVPAVVFLVAVASRVAAGAGDTAPAPHRVTGSYIEFCSCERICESAFGEPGKRATCSFACAVQIDAGQHGGVSLNGLTAAIVSPAPAAHEGKEAAPVLYVEKAANEEQREAIRAALNERLGSRLAGPLGPPRVATIHVRRTSEEVALGIEGMGELRARPVYGAYHRSVMLSNAGSAIAFPNVARGVGGQLVDATAGVQLGAEGRSALYGKFDFGPPKGRK